MKRWIALLALCASMIMPVYGEDSSCCECRTSAQSFIWIRPPFQVSSPERLAHFRDDRVERKDDGWLGAVQVVPLGGSLLKGDDVATYWGPSCNKTLIVNESVTASDTDILANHLNIYTANGNFSSRINFHFAHRYAGVGLYYQQEIYHTHTGRAIWFSIAVPIMHVQNKVSITEAILNNGGGLLPGEVASTVVGLGCGNDCSTCIQSDTLPIPYVGSVQAAFDQPGWCYGKIKSCHPMNETKVSNVEVRAALQIANNEHSHLESWAGVNVPTGNTPNGIYVFQPIVGHDHHFTVFMGSSFGVHVYENESRSLMVYSEFDFNIQYFFPHNETRSFDLVDRPWSRYMQLYDTAQATVAADPGTPLSVATTLHTPGINALTQSVKVKPGYARTFNVAWDLLWRAFELEVGYNFYAQQAECVDAPCIADDLALKKIGGELFDGGLGYTFPGQFINNNFFTAVEGYPLSSFQALTTADIDLHSAEVPAYLSHSFYTSVAYDWSQGCYPAFISLGGSYEFAPDNTARNKWMAFGKVGVSF